MANVCPMCGSHDISTSTNHKLKKGLGYVANFAAGFGLGYFLGGDLGGTIAENVDFTGAVEKEWECNRCHYIWKEGEQIARSIPDSYIIKKKNLLVMQIMPGLGSYIVCCIPISLVLWGIYYCFTHECGSFLYTWHGFYWWIVAIFTFFMFLWAISKISDIVEERQRAKGVDSMSVSQFKSSIYFKQVIADYKKEMGLV